jgi:threonine dehydrogenase-like Zn-dependent dehydrogenase
MKGSSSRRHFIQQMSGTALALAAANSTLAFADQWQNRVDGYSRKISPNDKIRIATIGMGIMGYNDTNTALKIPGTELVAVADLYSGRLARAKELYGNNIQVTADYKEILNRKDIDAVIIATADLWHARISIDALKAGKAVYCEWCHRSTGSGGCEFRQAKRTGRLGIYYANGCISRDCRLETVHRGDER